jgi:hypothetical protein
MHSLCTASRLVLSPDGTHRQAPPRRGALLVALGRLTRLAAQRLVICRTTLTHDQAILNQLTGRFVLYPEAHLQRHFEIAAIAQRIATAEAPPDHVAIEK